MKLRENLVIAAVTGACTLVFARGLPALPALVLAIGIALAVSHILRRLHAGASTDDPSVPLANVSHEIRTPLNGILGLTQLLLRMQPTPQQREYLESIRTSGQSLLRLMNDILDHSKLRSGAIAFEREDFRLRKWARDTVRSLAPQAHLSGLELAYWVEPDVPEELIGDPGRVRQVVTNLLVNAIKFTPVGEVALSVSLGSLEPGMVVLRFTITDTGIGVPEGQRRRIFQAFSQGGGRGGAGPYSTVDDGVGLGLAIAKDLVEAMGGEIGIESADRVGTTFYFTARFELRPDAVMGDDIAPTDPLPGFAVLVVDDSPAQRTALEKQMSAWGFDVAVACDEASALQALEDGREFSFVLVDSHIPGVDSWALARRLQARRPIPAVLMTLVHEHVDTERLREHGFLGYLTKPVAPTHLLRAIEITRRGANFETPEAVQTHEMDRLALAGTRVLLAEDHPVNRTVVVAMLEKIGCEVWTAENGREALELVKRQEFDAALIDVQMPEVDGLEVARMIRAREAATGDHLPLIAVTARTHDADRERCRQAGMDAFLSKPFQEHELVASLRRCLAHASRDDAGGHFDRAVALARAHGDSALLAELTSLFLDETPETLRAIDGALAASDAVTVERLAHRLKGSLMTLAADRAAALARSLETVARSGSLGDCPSILTELTEELKLLTPELEALTETT